MDMGGHTAHVGSAIHGLVGLGWIRKQAEQASKGLILWPLPLFLSPGPSFELLP